MSGEAGGGYFYPDSADEACTCPHDWTNTPPDLTAAGNQGRSARTWTRMLTVKTCPVHGEAA